MKVKVVYFFETHGLFDTFVFGSIYKLGGFQFKSINTYSFVSFRDTNYAKINLLISAGS